MELLEKAQLQKGQKYLLDLEKQYKITSANIEKELTYWYEKFAVNNQISMAEARKLLTTKELKEFRWTVEEYIKYGRENALNPQWMKELENASVRVHVSRLQALKLQLQQQVEVLYGNQTDDLDRLLRDIYTDGYYHTAYEIQKGFNVGWDLHRFNDKQLDRILSKPWSTDGRTFSDRLWTNKQQLLGTLQTKLTQSVIRGEEPGKAIAEIANQFNVDRKKAGRLVMTESAAFASIAQKDCFNALDVERFEIVATLDSHTSDLCQDLDGEVFDMKDYEVGVTAPPFHPWCRTVTAPWFEDNYGERAARDEDGKTYYVPSNMKYEEWYKKFVEGGSKDELKTISEKDILKIEIKEADKIKPDEWIDPNEIEPWNEITDTEKYEELVSKMEDGGWKGRPVLAYEDEYGLKAATGSHRIFAAREAKIEVPIKKVDVPLFKPDDELTDEEWEIQEIWKRFIDTAGDDDTKYLALKELYEKGEITEEILMLMKAEVNSNNLYYY